MRLILVRAGLIGLAAALSGCVEAGDTAPFGIGLSRVDPTEAAERALAGSAIGTALGVGIGASFAINPAIGAVVERMTGTGRSQRDPAPYLSARRPNVERGRLAFPSSSLWLKQSPPSRICAAFAFVQC